MTRASALAARLLRASRAAEADVSARGAEVASDGRLYTELTGRVQRLSVPSWEAPRGEEDVRDVLRELRPAYDRLPAVPLNGNDQRDVALLWEQETGEYSRARGALLARAGEELLRDPGSRRVVTAGDATCRTGAQVMLRGRRAVAFGWWRSQLIVPLLPLDLLCLVYDAASASRAGGGGDRELLLTCAFASHHLLPARGTWSARRG